MLTYDQVVASVAKGLKHRVVMPIDFSNGGDAIVADASVQSVADFKGKKVGFNPLSPSDFLLAYALQQNGMSDKDIDAVNMTPEGIPGAMASGNLPIGVTYEHNRSEEHTSELQSLMRISYAVFCLQKKKQKTNK